MEQRPNDHCLRQHLRWKAPQSRRLSTTANAHFNLAQPLRQCQHPRTLGRDTPLPTQRTPTSRETPSLPHPRFGRFLYLYSPIRHHSQHTLLNIRVSRQQQPRHHCGSAQQDQPRPFRQVFVQRKIQHDEDASAAHSGHHPVQLRRMRVHGHW